MGSCESVVCGQSLLSNCEKASYHAASGVHALSSVGYMIVKRLALVHSQPHDRWPKLVSHGKHSIFNYRDQSRMPIQIRSLSRTVNFVPHQRASGLGFGHPG